MSDANASGRWWPWALAGLVATGMLLDIGVAVMAAHRVPLEVEEAYGEAPERLLERQRQQRAADHLDAVVVPVAVEGVRAVQIRLTSDSGPAVAELRLTAWPNARPSARRTLSPERLDEATWRAVLPERARGRWRFDLELSIDDTTGLVETTAWIGG